MTATVEVAQSGQITIPETLRDDLKIEEGQKYDIRVLEGGILILTPQRGRATAILSEIREKLLQDGASLEDMLAELRRMREADV